MIRIPYALLRSLNFGEKNTSIFCNRDIVTKTTSSNNSNGSSTNFSGISAHTCILLHRNPNPAHVSENASKPQIDNTMTFNVLIVSMEQNEEFQVWRVYYTLAGVLNRGEGGVPWREGGGSGTLGTLPWLRPCSRKRVCRLSLKNRLAVERGKFTTIVKKTQQVQAFLLQVRLQQSNFSHLYIRRKAIGHQTSRILEILWPNF